MKLKNYQERKAAIPETTKAAVRMRNEISRLKELVKAQKELIKAMNARVTPHWNVFGQLRAKINQLQSKTEK